MAGVMEWSAMNPAEMGKAMSGMTGMDAGAMDKLGMAQMAAEDRFNTRNGSKYGCSWNGRNGYYISYVN